MISWTHVQKQDGPKDVRCIMSIEKNVKLMIPWDALSSFEGTEFSFRSDLRFSFLREIRGEKFNNGQKLYRSRSSQSLVQCTMSSKNCFHYFITTTGHTIDFRAQNEKNYRFFRILKRALV